MLAPRRKLSLFLPDPGNEWIRSIGVEATEAARRRGFALVTHFTENQAVEQIQQIFAALRAPQAERSEGFLVMPVHDQSLERVARSAVGAGVGWVCLHRATGDLDALRKEFPAVPISLVGPDQDEIGRIHGRQLLAMLPQGGRVLYVQGRPDNASTARRRAGMLEVIDRSVVQVADSIDGNWSTLETERAVGRWLRLLINQEHVDVVVCQNDAMAIGACHALRDAANAMDRPGLRGIPIIGCDGLPEAGRRMVDSGDLAATIVLPIPASAAVDTMVTALETRRIPPPRVLLQPESYAPRLRARVPSLIARAG